MNKNEQLIAQATASGAPDYLIDFMRAYPNVIPSVPCFITTAYQRYVANVANVAG